VHASGSAPLVAPPGSARTHVPPAPILVGLVGTVLVASGATGPSLWTDEAATISASTRSLGDLWRMAGTIDAVHTTYYLVMHAWTAAFGTSELALRSFSAIAVGVAAAGTYVLATRLVSTRLGLWAAAVFLLLPRVTWMGIEARPFALATAAGVWATVVLGIALDRRRMRWWAAYAALVAAAVLLNLYLVLLVLAHAVTVWFSRPRHARVLASWAVSAGAGLAVTAPMILVALGQQGQIGENDLGLLGLARNVVVNQWFLGETPTVYSRTLTIAQPALSWGSAWRFTSVALAAVALTLVCHAGYRVLRRDPRPAPAIELLRWAGPWIVVPTLVLAAYALVSGTYSPRYLAFASPAVAIVMAAALLSLRRTWVRTAAAALLVVLALPVLVSQRTENAKSGADWRQVARYVDDRAASGDGIYFAPRHPSGTAEERLTTRGIAVAYPTPFRELVDVTIEQTPSESGDLTGRSQPLSASADRLALVDRIWVVRRLDFPESARLADDAFLASSGFVRTDDWLGPLDEVVMFSRP
jgi:mannosyltransferase